MFGISPLGWVHTLGSLPAIPAAVYMLCRFGRIVPRSKPGAIYFVSMLIGAISVFVIANKPASFVIAAATLLFLFAGYGVGLIRVSGSKAAYIETFFLSVTAFLLMVPTATETLRRVPDQNPFVSDPKSPVLFAVQGGFAFILFIGLTLQIIHLRRKSNAIAV